MKNAIYVLFIGLFMACSVGQRVSNGDCAENLKFKERFFNNISIIEKYTLQKTKGENYNIKLSDFEKSLEKLSQYVTISYEEIFNYNNSYPSIEVFERDKKGWLIWYEENKCKNLKWKN